VVLGEAPLSGAKDNKLLITGSLKHFNIRQIILSPLGLTRLPTNVLSSPQSNTSAMRAASEPQPNSSVPALNSPALERLANAGGVSDDELLK